MNYIQQETHFHIPAHQFERVITDCLRLPVKVAYWEQALGNIRKYYTDPRIVHSYQVSEAFERVGQLGQCDLQITPQGVCNISFKRLDDHYNTVPFGTGEEPFLATLAPYVEDGEFIQLLNKDTLELFRYVFHDGKLSKIFTKQVWPEVGDEEFFVEKPKLLKEP